jgi:hypothetical protein
VSKSISEQTPEEAIVTYGTLKMLRRNLHPFSIPCLISRVLYCVMKGTRKQKFFKE